jgi:hypothetical protein
MNASKINVIELGQRFSEYPLLLEVPNKNIKKGVVLSFRLGRISIEILTKL